MTVVRLLTEVLKENRRIDREEAQRQQQSPVKEIKDAIVDYMDTVEDVPKGRDHEFICKLISEYFSQKVMQNLEDIMEDRKRAV